MAQETWVLKLPIGLSVISVLHQSKILSYINFCEFNQQNKFLIGIYPMTE